MLGQPVLRQVVGAALMLGLAGALAPAHAKTRITREGGKVVLENEFLKARIDPLRGARLESLVVRQERESVELVAGPSVIESVVLPNDKLLSLADMEFKEVPVGEKEDAQCVLEAALPKGEPLGRPASEVAVPYFPDVDYSHVKLEKRYVLGDGEARLRVLYRLTNAGAKPVTICLAFQQQFADPRGKRSRFFVPGAGGVTALPDRGAQRTFYDLAEGWVGVLSDVGLGTIRWFDPRYLSCIRVTGDGSRRTEMVSTEMDVAAGKSWEVESVVMPLVGMTGIQAGGRDFAAEITLPAPGAGAPPKAAPAKGPPSLPAAPPPGAVYSVRERLVGQLSFLPSQAMRVGLTLTARRLPAGKETRLSGRTNLPLQAGQAYAQPFVFTPDGEGTWVLALSLSQDGGAVYRIERPVIVGAPSGALAAAEVQRVGRVHVALTKAFPPPADYQPSMGVPSPHIPYARPYAQGPVRVLFLYPFWAGREIVELAERLDMEYDMAAMGVAPMKRELENGPAPAEEQVRAKSLLAKPHDVIVAAHSWGYWPEEVRSEVLRQVKEEGVGLACFKVAWPDGALEALQKAAKPMTGQFPGDGVKAIEHGKGRVAFVGTGPSGVMEGFMGPRNGPESGTHEKSVQTILWAAGKDPNVAITLSLPPGNLFNTDAPKSVSVGLANKVKEEVRGKLQVVFRQALDMQYRNIYWFYYTNGTYPWWEDRASVVKDVALAPAGQARVDVPVPAVPAGPYFVSATLRDEKGRVVSWRSEPLKVESPMSVEEFWLSRPGVEPVRCDYKSANMPQIGCKPTETLQARAVIRRDETKVAGRVSCSLRLVDGDGRVIFDEKKPVDAKGEAAFTTPLAHALHYALIAVVTGWADDKPLAENRAFIPVYRYPERDQKYRFTQLDNEGWVPFRLLGISEYNNGSSWNRFLECASQDYLFQAFGGEVKRAPVKDNVRGFCYNNPQQRQKEFEEARKNIKFYCQFAPHGHLFVDEYDYGGLQACQCDFCQAAYRDYLRGVYGTLEKLNQEYGTNYRRWDELRIYTLPEKAAIPRSDWPQAVDTCTWKTVQMTNYCGEVVKIGHEVGRDIEFGFSGVSKMTAVNGNDFWYMSQVGKYHVIYRDWLEWASMCGPQSVRLWRWYWRKYNPSEQQWLPWEILFRGEPGMGIFTCESYPSCYPDGRLFAGPKAYFEQFNEINRGPAKLLLGRDAKDGIALHWSSPSFYVYGMERWEALAKLGKDPKQDQAMDWPRRTAHFIDGAARGPHSLSPNYVAHAQLEKGNLGLWGTPKLIFLTYSPAMSSEEAETLKKFVRDGGTLVGQVNPASRDAHGKPYPTPLLDEVFGIRHVGPFQAPVTTSGRSPESIKPEEKGKVKDGIPVTIMKGLDKPLTLYPLVLAPGNVEAAAAESWGEYTLDGKKVPALLVHKYGRGQAVFLNFLTVHLNEITGEEWSQETAAACGAIVSKIVEMSGVKPWATITTNGEPGGTTLYRFEDGGNSYLGALSDWGQPPSYYVGRKVEITLPKPLHVYDIRRGKSLGLTDKLQPEFKVEWLANLYACLPYKVNGLDVALPAGHVKVGADAAFNVTVKADAPPGRHVIRVEVWNPAGELVKKYGYDFEAPRGTGQGDVYLALNDPLGEWRLRCTDVATGVAAEAKFTVGK